jgi:hypothetical protein
MIVEVYRNLHTGSWSIRNSKTGLVIDRVNQAHLTDATLVVQPAGRAKVLREKRKNVHAFIRGEWSPMLTGPHDPNRQVSYNPYKCGAFVLKTTGEPIAKANSVTLTDTGHAFIN